MIVGIVVDLYSVVFFMVVDYVVFRLLEVLFLDLIELSFFGRIYSFICVCLNNVYRNCENLY